MAQYGAVWRSMAAHYGALWLSIYLYGGAQDHRRRQVIADGVVAVGDQT